MSLLDLIPHQELAFAHRPWPRATVGEEGWLKAIDLLAAGDATLLGFWGEAAAVHMALGSADEVAVVSLACESGMFPSVAARHAPALRPERTIRDLFGLDAAGAADTRPWLDHGAWGKSVPPGKSGPPLFQIPCNQAS